MTDTMREEFERFIFDSNLEDDCQKSPRTYEYENMERDWLIWQAAQADARALVGELINALKDAHFELNAIRARDGAPQHIDWSGGRPLQTSSCTHEWFNTVVEQCDAAITKAQAFMEGK